jgi:hypothetical protein
MAYTVALSELEDNGGRRFLRDRRRATVRWDVVEQRSGYDRRINKDRRINNGYEDFSYLRRKTDRNVSYHFAEMIGQSRRTAQGLLLGISFSLLLWAAIISIVWRIIP